MGKPYTKELERLPEVYDWATKTSIDELSNFVKKSEKTPLYIIGSGGSFSATTFASLLHQETGTIAKCLTPLEFLEYENIDNDCSILIITAGGNNSDILSSFDKAVSLKPKNLGILCASTNNKLTRKASTISNVFVHALKLPTGKDGFLATNSLIATLIWLCRAYIDSYSLPYEIPRFNQLVFQGKSEQKFYEDLTKQLEKFSDKETIVLLYDNWAKIAAIDAESKLVEAGLINVQLSDYRNFAHGRHNWLDKNKEKTALLALVVPQSKQLATKTLKLIPGYIATSSISTNYDGPIASLALLIQVLFLVKFISNVRKIDPGRPRIAAFGRKIYHLQTPKTSFNILTKFEKLALRRKFGNADLSENKTPMHIELLHKFIDKISKEKFGAAIFDYDGTLCDDKHRSTHPTIEIGKILTTLLENNIIIGVATGRGKSVREGLQKIILEKFWSKIYIGYYNCSEIKPLGNNHAPDTKSPTDQNLKAFLEFLKEQNILSNNVKITERPNQITLEYGTLDATALINTVKTIDKTKLEKIRIVESNHSIDLLPENGSKLNIVNFIRKMIPKKYEILCIGDKAIYPGNDFELLQEEFSLSVDEVSKNENTCWKMLPNQLKGERGVIEYFNKFQIYNGSFKINLAEWKKS